MEACTHSVQYNGLCAVCGTLVESQGLNTINMGYDTVSLTVSRSEAERLESENAKRLLKDRKLSLILDLDQTLLHASCDPMYNNSDDDDIKQFTLDDSPIIYYIKLRPGLSEFLKEIEPLYELHIYTMGTRSYAEAVAKLIDPNGNFFKERILSRDESGSVTQKKLQRLFPCDTSMVVVIDDRSDVWNYSPNLIRIKPFEYFVGIGDINSKKEEKPFVENKVDSEESTTTSENNMVTDENSTSTENNHDSISNPDLDNEGKETESSTTTISKREQDKELYTIREILKKIHTTFYTQDPKTADVTRIIPLLKKKILENIVIVFSDVIPPTTKNPTLSWIWQMATSFGAICSTDLTGKTTHLIAVKPDRKVKAARLYGHSIHVVTPAWLLDSTARWAIQDEHLYELPPHTPNHTHNTTMSNNDNNFNNDTDYSEATSVDEEEEENGVDNIEKEKLTEEIDWAEADREVEDFINESGIDDVWDTDSDTKSGVYNANTVAIAAQAAAANFRRKQKRKRQAEEESGGESGGDDESEVDEKKLANAPPRQRSLLAIRRAKSKRRGKSHLSKVTTVSGNSSDNELNSDLSSLDDFAGMLDNAID